MPYVFLSGPNLRKIVCPSLICLARTIELQSTALSYLKAPQEELTWKRYKKTLKRLSQTTCDCNRSTGRPGRARTRRRPICAQPVCTLWFAWDQPTCVEHQTKHACSARGCSQSATLITRKWPRRYYKLLGPIFNECSQLILALE
jgi:hypothetical protein